MREIYLRIDGIKEELVTVGDMHGLSYRQGAIAALRDIFDIDLEEPQ